MANNAINTTNTSNTVLRVTHFLLALIAVLMALLLVMAVMPVMATMAGDTRTQTYKRLQSQLIIGQTLLTNSNTLHRRSDGDGDH